MKLSTRIARSIRYRARRLADRLNLRDRLVGQARAAIAEVRHGGQRLLFSTPNAMCRYRARSFSTKEPETLAWIEDFPEGAVLWDVGANVGLYSVYAAALRGCRVYAFEPSVFNLEFLARNIELNSLVDKVCIVPIPLGERTALGVMHMSSTEWGGALSTFDKTYGYDGRELSRVFDYATIAVSMDEAVEKLGIRLPDYLKLDVDGIEHLILAGGDRVLRSVQGVLVEVFAGFVEQAERTTAYLQQAGLTLVSRHADAEAGDVGTHNQIWARLS